MADSTGNYYGHGGVGGGTTPVASSSFTPGGGPYQPKSRFNKFNKNYTQDGSGGGGGGGGTTNDAQQQASRNDHGKIFVGGLSWQTTEESLRWHFEQYGQVTHVELMKDRNTGKPRGFGFVSFADAATVDLVMTESHEVNHKLVDVKRAQARGIAPPSIHESKVPGAEGGVDGEQPLQPTLATPQAQPPTFQNRQQQQQGQQSQQQQQQEFENNKVFVGGIPPQVDRDQLRDIMEQFGTVVDCIVMLDPATMRSRGFGFVTFEPDSEGANNAIAAQPIQIFNRNVEVKLATPRGGGGGGDRSGIVGTRALHGGSSSGSVLGGSGTGPGGGGMVSSTTKFLGLRAGQSALATTSRSSGEYAGLAVAYGRNGWKAGFGSKAFGKHGWNIDGWDLEDENDNDNDNNDATTTKGGLSCGFSFDYILDPTSTSQEDAQQEGDQQHQEQYGNYSGNDQDYYDNDGDGDGTTDDHYYNDYGGGGGRGGERDDYEGRPEPPTKRFRRQ